jgi:hypothetical protein
MALSAEAGPLVTFTTPQFDSNPSAGPNVWHKGDMIGDPRVPYTYQPGQAATAPVYGWSSANAIPLVDQVPSAVSTTNIAAAQVPVAATPLTLASATANGITVGCSIINAATGQPVTGLLGIDVNTAAAPQPPVQFGQDASITIWNPAWAISRCLQINSVGNDSTATFLVVGFDQYFFPMTQLVTGANAGVATTLKAFKYIQSITPAGTLSGSNVSVGTTDTYGIPLRTDRFPYLQGWWGTPQVLMGGSGNVDLEMPFQFADWGTGAATYNIDPGFDGVINSVKLRVEKPGTGTGATQTLTAQVAGTNVTGGVVNPTLANTATAGSSVAGTSITALNAFTAAQAIGVNLSSGGTVFTGGDGFIELNVTSADAQGGTFTGAITTSPATNLTGDVRGTLTLPSASDGTKRLTIFWTPIPANLTTTSGLVGVPQV